MTLLAGTGLGLAGGAPGLWENGAGAGGGGLSFLPLLRPLPGGAELRTAIADLAAPQLALTLTNAVIPTSLVAHDLYGARAAHVSPRRLCPQYRRG
ncbi:MAG: hypothetical protein M5U35_16765 [Roseovarius sp.]|nr:hypothetical protein [Roseovarius sp.]